jgi:archaellum component FlaC
MKQVSAKYNLDYKLTNDFNKIVQIIDQYRVKYSKDLNTFSKNVKSLNTTKEELTRIILYFYEKVNKQSDIS